MLRDTSAQRVRVETIDVFLLLFGCLLQRNVYVYIIACVLKKKKKERKENNNKIKTRSTLIILINQNKLFFYIN